VVSVAGSLRDFRIDIGGSTVWHSVLHGQKVSVVNDGDETCLLYDS